MGGFFFSGSSASKLDGKNRFVLPHEMRLGLVEGGRLEFTLALGLGGCLVIYRKGDIEKIARKFQTKQHIACYQQFFTLFFSTLYPTTCDKVGRVTVSPILKHAVGMKNDVIVAGVLNKIEIWPRDRYEANLRGLVEGTDDTRNFAAMAEAAFALLEEKTGDEEELEHDHE